MPIANFFMKNPAEPYQFTTARACGSRRMDGLENATGSGSPLAKLYFADRLKYRLRRNAVSA
jgi:hypothetical protein